MTLSLRAFVFSGHPHYPHHPMLHPSIGITYTAQKKRFRRLISLWFSAAGVYWLVMYGAELLGAINIEEMQVLRTGQTVIYFVLLTLWGMEYLREARRLALVITTANERRTAPDEIQASELSTHLHWFSILRPVGTGLGAKIVPALNILGLAISLGLIAAQYGRLVSAIMK